MFMRSPGLHLSGQNATFFAMNVCLTRLILLGVIALQMGCESHSSGVTQTDTKTQIEQLFNLYKSYVNVNRKGPPIEQALRDFAKRLSEQQLEEQLIAKDVDSIFVSARDKEPFQIVYGQTLNPGGNPVAVIYEKTGLNGSRYAALSMGYTEEYDEATPCRARGLLACQPPSGGKMDV